MTDINLKILDAKEIKEERMEGLSKIGRKRKEPIKGEKIVVAEKKGEVVGYASLINSPRSNEAYIDNIKVKEKERKKGIGKKLEKKIEETAEKNNLKKIRSDLINPESKKFWKSQGYKTKEKGMTNSINKRIKQEKKKRNQRKRK